MVGNVDQNARTARDYFGFDLLGNQKSSSRAKKNQNRRRVFHAPLGTKLIAILFVADETDRAWIARHRDVCRAHDNHAVNNFDCRRI